MLMLACAVSAYAGPTPAGDLDHYQRESKSRFDPRIRIVEYNPLAIVTIKQALGYATHIQLGADEEVVDISAGDSLAWEVAPSANHLFLKPREADGRTNISVVTNKRLYQFVVDVVPKAQLPDSEMTLFLIFMYPDNPVAKQAEVASKREVATMRKAMQQAPAIRNTSYEACRHDADINPVAVWDDGRFTYMRFRPGQSLPSIQKVLPDGQEAIVNYRMGGQEGDGDADSRTMVIFETAPKFIVRFGKAKSCVMNRSTEAASADPADSSGSTKRGFMRMFKGE